MILHANSTTALLGTPTGTSGALLLSQRSVPPPAVVVNVCVLPEVLLTINVTFQTPFVGSVLGAGRVMLVALVIAIVKIFVVSAAIVWLPLARVPEYSMYACFIATCPPALIVPLTSSFAPGFVVPIPTFPVEVMRIDSVDPQFGLKIMGAKSPAESVRDCGSVAAFGPVLRIPPEPLPPTLAKNEDVVVAPAPKLST